MKSVNVTNGLTQQIWLTVVAHPDRDREGSGSSPGHTKDFKNGT